jgi:hypothetical protein
MANGIPIPCAPTEGVYQVGSIGLSAAMLLCTLGALIVGREWLREREFRKKVFID